MRSIFNPNEENDNVVIFRVPSMDKVPFLNLKVKLDYNIDENLVYNALGMFNDNGLIDAIKAIFEKNIDYLLNFFSKSQKESLALAFFGHYNISA